MNMIENNYTGLKAIDKQITLDYRRVILMFVVDYEVENSLQSNVNVDHECFHVMNYLKTTMI